MRKKKEGKEREKGMFMRKRWEKSARDKYSAFPFAFLLSRYIFLSFTLFPYPIPLSSLPAVIFTSFSLSFILAREESANRKRSAQVKEGKRKVKRTRGRNRKNKRRKE